MFWFPSKGPLLLMLILAFVAQLVCLQTAHFVFDPTTDLEKKKGQFRGHNVVLIDKQHGDKDKHSSSKFRQLETHRKSPNMVRAAEVQTGR